MTTTENQPSGSAMPEKDVVGAHVEKVSKGSRPWSRYLDASLGLKEYWYPVFFSSELDEDSTRAEEVCGNRILFKRADGRVYGVVDRCAHRGVAFSSRPECMSKNTISCWFHGFTYDVRDGKLVQVLSHPESRLKGKLSIPTFPTHEEFGLVWVFIGDGDPTDFYSDLPKNLQKVSRGDQRRAFFPLVRVKIPCDWRLAIENGLDPGHVFAHRHATVVASGRLRFPLAYYPESKILGTDTSEGHAAEFYAHHEKWTHVWEAEVEGNVVSMPRPAHAKGDDPTLFDAFGGDTTSEDLGGDGGVLSLPCLFEAVGFPDGRQTHLEWFVPIDETHHMYIIQLSQPVESDEDEQAFFAECREDWGPLIWSKSDEIVGFSNFDAFGRAEIAHGYDKEDFWHNERLYKPDYALTEWRMFVSRNARAIASRSGLVSKPQPPEESMVQYVF